MSLKIGTPAPAFSLPATTGKMIDLNELKGQACVLFFYPKAFTGTCTAEVCEFKNHFEDFKDLNITVLGISKDTMPTLLKFKEQYKLPYELLSDPTAYVCRLYDTIVPVIGLVNRVTYLLDKQHQIVATYADMFDAKAHIRKMIDKIKQA